MTPEEALRSAVIEMEAADKRVRDAAHERTPAAVEAQLILADRGVNRALAFATIASAGAMLMPPEIAVESEVVDDATERLTAVEAVLDEARRNGPRHPAVHAALEIIRGGRSPATP